MEKRNQGLQQGMSAIQSTIEKRRIELAQEKVSINRLAETVTNKSERQMMQVLSEYPDALEIMSEPAFLKWVISSLKYQNMYIKARLQENPNPWSLEHLLLSYQFVKLEENTSFVKWLESLDKNEVDPAIMAVNDLGHFKPLKKLLKKWSTFDSI